MFDLFMRVWPLVRDDENIQRMCACWAVAFVLLVLFLVVLFAAPLTGCEC